MCQFIQVTINDSSGGVNDSQSKFRIIHFKYYFKKIEHKAHTSVLSDIRRKIKALKIFTAGRQTR